jgi:hypothetical protein
MIEVQELGNGRYEISWDENDPVESQLNHWEEKDFIKCLCDACDELKGDTK